jgi:glucose/arabinose dehydrogenase
MQRRRTPAVLAATLALVASALGLTQGAGSAATDDAPQSAPQRAAAHKATMPAGFRDVTAIGGVSQPVAAAFAPDGTAFIGLQTGVIKSFDFNGSTGTFEAAATSTDFADLSVQVENYGDRGLTGITVDPQFPARPYVYVNYTLNADPANPPDPANPADPAVPAWGTPGQAYDNCGPNDSDEAELSPPKRGCPVMDRVSRLTAARSASGWVMTGPEKVLVQDGCAQFSSHSSGDVLFGPDGMLYASAGDGASFRGADSGQANDGPGYPAKACPGDPANEGGSLRSQDQRSPGDALGIDGTIFKLDPNTGLAPAQGTANQWLVAMGQRNPWRLTFRPGNQQLWSVDVGSSNWEEINVLQDYRQTLANRGWPCYEGPGVNPTWTPPSDNICPSLPAAAVQGPFFSYRTRTLAGPITPGENCPVRSSSLSGIAFTPTGTDWPASYQDALFFSDFLRGCIWRFAKDANGQPNPSAVQVFAQAAGSPTDVLVGPGGDLYYVDYGSFAGGDYIAGSGGLHRIDYVGATAVKVKSSPAKVKIKVGHKRHRTPYRTDVEPGSVLRLVAPTVFSKKGVRYVFTKWKGVKGKQAKKRKLKLRVGDDDLTVKAVYRRARR